MFRQLSYSQSGERGNWSETGCVVADIDEESGVVVCHCNHLTNFAVLVVSMRTRHGITNTSGMHNEL